MTTFRFPAKNNHPSAMAEGGGRLAPPTPAKVPSVFRRFLVRVTPAERLAADGKDVVIGRDKDKDEIRPPQQVAGGEEAEVGSVALDRMVLSFMEDAAAAVDQRPPRGRCNCFNGQHDASDDEDFDFLPSSSAPAAAVKPPAAGDALELIKGLVQCASAAERALLADASRIAERCGKQGKKKAEVRRAVAAGLRAVGYDAAVCRSRWDKGPSYPAGEHEYIDALLLPADSGLGPATTPTTTTARVVVEVDFRAEFEVARPTKPYRAALQALPPLFVGTPDRLGKIVAVVAEAARQSLRKRGLHFPPWRKAEYMRAKWLAPHSRSSDEPAASAALPVSSGEAELRFVDKVTKSAEEDAEKEDESNAAVVEPEEASKQEQSSPQPQPQASNSKGKVVAGLASVLS